MQFQNLGRYRIVKELGRGAMGRVFLAHDPQIDRPVAIKAIQIFSSLPDNEQAAARERFLREARSAGKLLHPGIVTIFDVGEAEGVPYLAMEYVEGQTLDAFCRPDGLLPVGTAVEIVARAAEALDYAHQAGIVHRDVKPANLMRVGETSVKIMDFGLAKNPQTQLTQDGMLMGTPNYMSPEQVRGDALDRRSDLFSLGVVLYEMLTGEKPFGGESVSSVLYRIVNEDAPDAYTQRPSLPPGLSEFLRKALAKDPGDRYPDGEAFAAALRKAGEGAPAAAAAAGAGGARTGPSATERRRAPAGPPRSADVSVAEPPRRGKRGLLGALGAAAILAALAGGAYVVFRGLPGAPSKPAEIWFESRVRTEPPGVPVELDGKPISGESVRYSSAGPFGVLTAEQECRKASHNIGAEDAGREIVLVLDPLATEVVADPGIPGAGVRLNGAAPVPAPARLSLKLCAENVIEVSARGYRPARVTVPAGATPLEARTAAAELRLSEIPTGRLKLPATPYPVAFFVDGRRVEAAGGSIELPEGSHQLRAVDEERWIDVRTEVSIAGGETATPRLALPGMAELVVQAFPGNCKVYLRRDEGDWRFLDEAPVTREIAAGRYRIKVEHEPTGESREQDIELVAGPNNRPLRFGFERGGRR